VGAGAGVGADADGTLQALNKRTPITRIGENIRVILSPLITYLISAGKNSQPALSLSAAL